MSPDSGSPAAKDPEETRAAISLQQDLVCLKSSDLE